MTDESGVEWMELAITYIDLRLLHVWNGRDLGDEGRKD